ncbi:MAG: rRNA maturation RNase YbeY [Chlamydiae bacterium]|nr:rRNA maturation RNase YbeY [Chlamydiota bacterium]
MNVEVFDFQKSLKVSKQRVALLVEAALKFLKIKTDLVSIHFVSKSKIKEIHNLLFQDPSLTDCITQPYDPPGLKKEHHFLGEVFICALVAKEWAKKIGADPYDELTLYIIHTLLHLSGLEDTTPEKAKKMRVAEKKVFEHLKSVQVSLK